VLFDHAVRNEFEDETNMGLKEMHWMERVQWVVSVIEKLLNLIPMYMIHHVVVHL
jgi:hypothetical protein